MAKIHSTGEVSQAIQTLGIGREDLPLTIEKLTQIYQTRLMEAANYFTTVNRDSEAHRAKTVKINAAFVMLRTTFAQINQNPSRFFCWQEPPPGAHPSPAQPPREHSYKSSTPFWQYPEFSSAREMLDWEKKFYRASAFCLAQVRRGLQRLPEQDRQFIGMVGIIAIGFLLFPSSILFQPASPGRGNRALSAGAASSSPVQHPPQGYAKTFDSQIHPTPTRSPRILPNPTPAAPTGYTAPIPPSPTPISNKDPPPSGVAFRAHSNPWGVLQIIENQRVVWEGEAPMRTIYLPAGSYQLIFESQSRRLIRNITLQDPIFITANLYEQTIHIERLEE
ncbi:MAG: hypothetical protein AB1656_24620 [Candidatus Omnitrophota bacterium]